MKSKTLEALLATESGFHSDMVTRFQKLRESSLLSRARGRNAEFLNVDEVVSGIFSMVSGKPGFAAMTAIGLRKLKPVGLPEDAFAQAPTLAAAIGAALQEPILLATVKEIRLGDRDPTKGMMTAAVVYSDGKNECVSLYVPETALSLFAKGKEKEFDRLSLGLSVTQETILAPRLLEKIARGMTRARELAALEGKLQLSVS
ncbi:hypothetical protein J1C56_08405 [Aminobacter anthyllidis]|uniref:Uncharacterized protein n=1 Tax=Aminobacter anthyllidis TaxID=1035067 RepID=A0A9X1D5C6_9HYPH|nr:hypothetical protein [Aminobacter anthyllidis]MBT1155614.1 hypothetical protein [Aminobacter anthyllidis]